MKLVNFHLISQDFSTVFSDANALVKAKIFLQKKVHSKKLEMECHLKKASLERKSYQSQGLDSKNPANSTLLLSVDFKKGVMFPYFRRTVQQIYFLKRPVAQVFGVVNESSTPAACHLYFYSNDVGSTHWGNVVSLLEHWLNTEYVETPDTHIGTNSHSELPSASTFPQRGGWNIYNNSIFFMIFISY